MRRVLGSLQQQQEGPDEEVLEDEPVLCSSRGEVREGKLHAACWSWEKTYG